jgi:hypothetical protein
MSATPVLAPARWGLRHHAASAAVLALAAALGLGAAVPALATGRLRFTTVADGEWAPPPGPLAVSAARVQQRGADTLGGLARGLGVATVGVAGFSMLVLAVGRGATRRSEVVVRRATGASRRVLAGGLGLEGAAIAVVGVGAGLAAGTGVMHVLTTSWPGALGPPASGARIAVLALAAGTLLVVGAVLPLVHARHRAVSPGTGGEELWLPLPAVQFGVALTALMIAGQIARRAADLADAGPAARGEVWVIPVAATPDDPEGRAAAWDTLLDRVAREVPGASLTSPGAALGLGRVDVATTDCGQCAQGGIFVPHRQVPAVHHLVSPDSFRALGLPVRAGRGIADTDSWRAPRVAVVSADLARRHFQDGHAVGRLIRIGRAAGAWYTVVGIAGDRPVGGFGGAGQPPFAVYLSIAQHPPRAAELLLDAPVGGGSGVAAVPEVLRVASIGRPETLSALRAAQAAPHRWFARLIRLEGWAALGAAALGMFAVTRLWVRTRLPELAVRRALGARRRHVLGFVTARAAAVTGGGVVVAWWLAPLVSDVAARVVPGLPGWHPGQAFAPVAALTLATAAGVMAPAWRVATEPPAGFLGLAGP